MVEWRHINWRKLEKRVFKLPKRIYRAEQRGDTKAVRRLQKTLMRSWSAKCLAVRRVTQDNQGKKTAGVDGIKSLSPVQRLKLVTNLKLSYKAKPTRRVWIPKPGTEEKRPLGIPTMADRALQALVKLALEPEWEAKFEPNSYGFRPGRILHEDLAVVQKCQQIIAEWLKSVGLELKPSKTRLTHTLNKYKLEEPGFDFLGFNIKQYPVGKYQSGKSSNKTLLGFKILIKPSKKKLKIHTEKISSIIKSHKTAPQEALIDHLNPVVQGWANNYSTVVSKESYKKADMLTYQQLRAWANSRHANKTPGWVAKKYWQTLENDNWSFASRKKGKTMRLKKHSETPIIRHVKVQGNRSPYDGDLIYWSTRMGKHPEVSTRVATLLKRQKGKCAHCGLIFRDGDLIETDHKTPKSQGGRDSYDNWQLLHRHCHDVKTTNDDKVGGMRNKHQSIEEPCAEKSASTVLKTSRSGDGAA